MHIVRRRIRARAQRYAAQIAEYMSKEQIEEFYIAGSCMASDEEPHDIDIYPVHGEFEIEGAYETPNAYTVFLDDLTLQLCNFKHDSLSDLLDSFDFAHVKVGAKVTLEDGKVKDIEVAWKEEWLDAKAVDDTWFTGSEYPLSSLVRAMKYAEYGKISRKQQVEIVIDVLAAILERGFEDYEDFKDQLDAVDLGVLPDNLDDVSWHSLNTIMAHFGIDVGIASREAKSDEDPEPEEIPF